MKESQKIKDLNKKIESKSKMLLDSIKSHIDKKCVQMCASVDNSIRKEKMSIKKKSENLLKELEERISEQNRKISRIKAKMQKISDLVYSFDKSNSMKKIEDLKREIEKTLKEHSSKYDNIRNEQKKLYKAEFEKIREKSEGMIDNNTGKLKVLLE